MERLTEHFSGNIRIKGCKTVYQAEERKGAPMASAIARLAAYEDTGLMPDEIMALISPNDVPLTLGELLKMEGEEVYCVRDYEITVNGEKGHRAHDEEWGIVTCTDQGDHGFIAGTERSFYHFENYGKTWLAYRRRCELH